MNMHHGVSHHRGPVCRGCGCFVRGSVDGPRNAANPPDLGGPVFLDEVLQSQDKEESERADQQQQHQDSDPAVVFKELQIAELGAVGNEAGNRGTGGDGQGERPHPGARNMAKHGPLRVCPATLCTILFGTVAVQVSVSAGAKYSCCTAGNSLVVDRGDGIVGQEAIFASFENSAAGLAQLLGTDLTRTILSAPRNEDAKQQQWEPQHSAFAV